MSTVPRKIPHHAKYILFNFKNDKSFGMLNLCCWRDEINKIINTNKVIKNKKINIYYPIFDKFYVKEYRSNDDFTLSKLMEKIERIGIQAGKYDVQKNPQHYNDPKSMTNIDFIGEYAITSTDKKSNIQIKDDKVYISLEH